MSIKEIYILALSFSMSLLPLGCTRDMLDGSTEVFSTGKVISFNTLQSRAEIQNVANIKQFSVWGWYQRGEEYTTLFNNTTVTQDNGWQYEGTQYWKTGMLHHFYAVHPISTISKATYNQLGEIKIIGFDASATNEAAIDLMLAEATHLLPNQNEIVNLVFQHILSRVHIAAQSDRANTIITSITIDGIKTHGNYYKNNWDTGNYPINTYNNSDAHNLNAGECLILSALTIPQNINQLSFSVHYKRDGQPKTGQIQLTNVKWISGCSYKYLITLRNDDLLLSVTVNNNQLWQDGSDSDIEFN